MLAAFIRVVASRAAAVFYRLERRGPDVPAGPVIIAANHPNSLIDPLVIFRTAGRHARPLAKAPLFERPVIGRLIRGVGGLPVYRREDGVGGTERNEETFRATSEALLEGSAIQIFPEGRSHSEPAMSELRTGVARMALAAEDASGWTAGVRIVPVGLTYEKKRYFRGRAIAVYGEPIHVGRYRDAYAADPFRAARRLTDELGDRLMELTLNLARSEDAHLIDTAERLYARQKALVGWREPAALAERLPRLQAFARGLAWLRAHHPERHRLLERRVRRYRWRTRVLGVGEGDVPDRYRLRPGLRWALRVALPAMILAPLALAAAAVWWVPYRLVGWGVARARSVPDDVVATYKLAGSMIAMPLFLALWTAAAAGLWGRKAALLALVGLPVLGIVGLAAQDLLRRVRDDVRLFGRVAGRADLTAWLADERRALVQEFDRVRDLVQDAADEGIDDASGPGRAGEEGRPDPAAVRPTRP